MLSLLSRARPALGGAGRLTALLALLAAPASAHEIAFHLVPEAAWNDGRPSPRAFLPAGQVLLFRPGEYRPALVLEANVFQPVPPGRWLWLAEAPGYVSVVGGSLQLAAEGEPVHKTIIWPVAPACALDLGGEPWRGVVRLDAVSLDRQATYPVLPAERRRVWVPAGRFLTYTVTSRGVSEISPAASCHAGELLDWRRPPAPSSDRQDLMVSAQLPAGFEGTVAQLGAVLAAAGVDSEAAITPTARIAAAGRVTFFFLGAPADLPLALELEHPGLLGFRRLLPPLPGEVRELEEIALRRRLALELSLEYMPKRRHERAELVLLRCGATPRRHPIEIDPAQCIPIGAPQPLVAGLTAHRFEELDTGWYLLDANVDDERVMGLGSWLAPALDAESPPVTVLPAQRLEEMHVYGELLVGGEAVAGEVRLDPFPPGAAPRRRFATDDELLYHLYYFAQELPPFAVARLPEDVREKLPEDLRGLYFGYQLEACGDDGFCRVFHHDSTLTGEGRLDLDLGSERRLRVRVLDADTGAPVAGAKVVLGRPHERKDTLHFIDGETRWNRGSTVEAPAAVSDAAGEVRLRQVEEGEMRLAVLAAGYRRFEEWLEVVEKQDVERVIELEPETGHGGLHVRFADGRPAAQLALLAMRRPHVPDYPCTRATNGQGVVELPPLCLEDRNLSFVLLHPQAVIREVSAAELSGTSELVVEMQRELPVRLRLVDAAGAPLADAPIALRFSGFELGPNHFLAAATHSGLVLPFRTNAQGEVTLLGLEASRGLPLISIAGQEAWSAIPVAPPGEVVELVLARPQEPQPSR